MPDGESVADSAVGEMRTGAVMDSVDSDIVTNHFDTRAGGRATPARAYSVVTIGRVPMFVSSVALAVYVCAAATHESAV
ncbi:hypothetical protein GCM10025867_03980 [Frondihabitans sucicola]|uniref:Uncharacterized protein n=1 Tax=Frondihabitans sucicola TaxID=1268041 RepID=A0ABM8GII0_9MICO|nr:hypothetical protein GCM10025867_03980 [Frondihabitans sucicola]